MNVLREGLSLTSAREMRNASVELARVEWRHRRRREAIALGGRGASPSAYWPALAPPLPLWSCGE